MDEQSRFRFRKSTKKEKASIKKKSCSGGEQENQCLHSQTCRAPSCQDPRGACPGPTKMLQASPATILGPGPLAPWKRRRTPSAFTSAAAFPTRTSVRFACLSSFSPPLLSRGDFFVTANATCTHITNHAHRLPEPLLWVEFRTAMHVFPPSLLVVVFVHVHTQSSAMCVCVCVCA